MFDSMMAKEETISKLSQLLKVAGVDRDTALNVSLRLRKPGKAEKMIEWLECHDNATPEEICKMSRALAKATS